VSTAIASSIAANCLVLSRIERRIVRCRPVPRYRDIAERLMEQVLAGELAPGDEVPSIRTIAADTGAAPATVGRAFAELARLDVIVSAPRRAARVAPEGATAARRALYGQRPALRLAGSDDPLLDLLAAGVERVGARGSFGGLAALWQRRADAATIHVRHRDGSYNDSFAAGVLGDRRPLLVHLWRREQGILVPRGNPDAVASVSDLLDRTVALRAAGTGTRVLVDRLLRETGADPGRLRGPVMPSHLEAAMAVAAGLADAAVGLRAPAGTLGLDFLPLAWEPFELLLPEDHLDAAGELLGALDRAPAMAGTDLSDAGAIRRP
jgi:molybdate-binding protein